MPETGPKYPNVTVKLIGENGNVFNLIGLVSQALRKAQVPASKREAFTKEAFDSGSYDEALRCIMRWVNVE